MLYSSCIRPHTTFYTEISEHGWTYEILAFPLKLLIHDTYFYWAHPHHKSTKTSRWAAYAFHPLEAVVESLIFVVFLFSIPVHTIHLMLFFIFSLIYNVYGHLGCELYPKRFNRHWLGKWINTSTCHNQHHHYFEGNYGLYFTLWDRLMGTLNKNYDDAFEEVTSRRKIRWPETLNWRY